MSTRNTPQGRWSVGAGLGEVRVTEGLPTGLGGGQSGLPALADDLALAFGEGREKVQREVLVRQMASARVYGALGSDTCLDR